MSDDHPGQNAPDPAQLQAAIDAVTAQLADLSAQVAAMTGSVAARGADSSPVVSGEPPAAVPGEPSPAVLVYPPASVGPPAVPVGPIPATTMPPAQQGVWPVPPGAVMPAAVLPGAPGQSRSMAPPPFDPRRPVGAPGGYPVAGALQMAGAPRAVEGWPAPVAESPRPDPERPASSSWADTSGLKALGWVGGAVTVLGVVMLLVVAIQQRLLTPEARVGIGAGLAVVLVVGGYLLRRKESQTAVAVTVVCTGLAVGYLTIVGATRLDDPLVIGVAHGLSVVVVAVAVMIALRWRESWLAGAAFAVSALLAPVVARDLDIGVYLFEAVLMAAAAGALLLGLGLVVWASTGLAVTVVLVAAIATESLSPAGLLAIIVMAMIAWALMYGRWLTDRAPRDPGPFPLRPRAFDPEQIARDYADFHAHQARADAARVDAAAASVSLGISGGFLALAFALVDRPTYLDNGVAVGAALFAVLFGVLAWVSGRIPAINHTASRLIAWSVAVALAAVALLRFLDGDARAVAWLILAIVVFVVVGLERMSVLVIPAITLGVIALLGSGQALSPRAVTFWPSSGILADGGGLLPRAWQAVFPAGLCVLALCFAAWWAISRCSAAQVDAARLAQSGDSGSAEPPATPGAVERDLASAESQHTAVMAWTIVCCSLVACYGLLVLTMVLAYAVSPTRAGFQAGQIVVTLLVTLVALVLLWQGFRRFILRIGGLCIALVAVAKLLLVDTAALEALPRSLTVIGVGVLLLLAAVAYVMALSRLGSDAEVGVGAGVETGPQHATDADTALPPAPQG